jgi:predicted nucleotidyltransferase
MRFTALLSADDWSTFWPAFIATALGVVLGIPAGFLLSRLVAWINGRKSRIADAKRLSDTLGALVVSLDVNDDALNRLQKMPPNTVLLSHGFDLATWDMAKSDVQKLVKPIDFRIPLAQYFEDVRQILEIVDDLNSYSAGVNSTLISAPTIRNSFLEHIRKRTPLAAAKGRWLRDQIVELNEIQTLKHPLDPVSPNVNYRPASSRVR